MKSIAFTCILLCSLLLVNVNSRKLSSNLLGVNSYVISLSNLDLEKKTFDGSVSISFAHGSGVIEMNADLIEITSIKMGDKDCTHKIDEHKIVQVDCGLEAQNDVKLDISYSGTIVTDEMYGLYLSTFGEDQKVISTQFEPTYARRLFPCFDEPEYKATFEITVDISKLGQGYSVLSNTKATSSENFKYVFAKTPVMSTYLVALVISNFEAKSPTENEGYEYVVYARPDAKDYTTTAVNYGRKLIDEMGTYTGIKYQDLGIDKSYQVAIPDFAAGAMENWGLVTYRESTLLDEGDKTTTAGKQKIITVIAHELAHQWFGDYVTLNWWSDTWLNEGFATYFESHIATKVEDNLDIDKQFLVDVMQPVLITDSASTVQALYTENVDSLAEINDKFSTISYDKGGSIIRMIRFVLGEELFKKVLNNYLTYFKQKNADHNNLLNAIKDHYEHSENFRKWIEQPGYPLVSVSLDNMNLVLTQTKYGSKETNIAWDIPITITTSSNPQWDISSIDNWFKSTDGNYIKTVSGDEDWYIVNVKASGYYRVKYASDLLEKLIKALKNKPDIIDELNRSQLIDDVFNLAIIGGHTYEQAFELANYLSQENSYYPWATTFNVISALLDKIGDETVVSGIKERMITLMKSVIVIPEAVDKLDGNPTHIEILKTVAVLKWACNFGHPECIKFATNVFNKYVEDKTSIENNYRGFSLCSAIRHSSSIETDWEKLWKLYGDSETSHEKDDILYALGCATDSSTLEKFLSLSIDESSGIRKQDAVSVFRAVLKGGKEGVEAGLKFLENNFDKIQQYYKGMGSIGDMVTRLSAKIVTKDHVTRLTDFLTKKADVEEIKVVAQQALEVANSNLVWSQTHLEELQNLFPTSGSSTTTTTTTDSSTTTTGPTGSTTSTPVPTGSTSPDTPTPSPGGANSISYSMGIVLLTLGLLLKL